MAEIAMINKVVCKIKADRALLAGYPRYVNIEKGGVEDIES